MTADLFDEGARLASEGMAQAVEHAYRVEPNWSDRAYAAFVKFARQNAVFTSEGVRAAAEAEGLPLPPDMRAWGAIVKRAVSLRVVTSAGYTTSNNPQAHSRPIRRWQSLVNSAVARPLIDVSKTANGA